MADLPATAPARAVVLLACALAAATPVAAQSTAQMPLQFDFLTPGARSLALGGAFLAVADDATAAFTNPAGLTRLIRPEVSLELRYRELETPYLQRGRLSGFVTNHGEDTIAGPVYAGSLDAATRPYFLSFVYPFRQASIAVYRHELTTTTNAFDAHGTFEQALFAGEVINDSRSLPLSGSREIRIVNYGGSAAHRFSDKFSAGAGVSIYHFALGSSFRRLGFQGGDVYSPVDPSFTEGSTATQDADDIAVAINAGALVTPVPRLQLAGVYRQGAAFDFVQVDTIPGRPVLTRHGRFRSPDVFGAGIRVEPATGLTLTADYDRVRYSRLKEDFIDFQAISTGTESRLVVEDGNEYHAGIEYVVTGPSTKPAFRAGYWFDPAHAVKYQSDGTGSQLDVRLQATLPGGENLHHYAAGFGMTVSSNFEFNVAADLTTRRTYASASMVVRFGK